MGVQHYETMSATTDPLDAAFEEDQIVQQQKRATALNKVYLHYFFCCAQAVMPFSQKSNLILTLPEFSGDVRQVGLFTTSMASASGITEFIVCPFLGKCSDSNGRKTFMNTFSGTTCAGASVMDIFGDHPDEMGAAFGGLLTPIGAGLIIGPIIGQAFVKFSGGRPEYAYLGASCCAAVQLLNVMSMEDTLPKAKLKPFEFSLSMINPVSFISLFCMKGRSTLAKLSLMSGFLQKADEGKNLADLHQIYAMKDVGMSPEARGNFVSAIGPCVLLSVRMCKLTMSKLGGQGHTTLSNMICIGSLIFFATVPRMFKKAQLNWVPMFLGILISSLGWNADTYVKSQASVHAEAAGIGNGEYSGMLANMRSVMSTLAPSLYARVYAWSTSGGRQMPGLAYLISALFKVVAELTFQSMSHEALENPPAKQ